ncbi:hypothetical protein LZ554_003542 [Drepanopeziza brunnea f. sp. 'monogermtubi']|nr:hypothetical protein LZ554_003542 [Drepanopeziza brunnea f. sp. 'monogermtubi']
MNSPFPKSTSAPGEGLLVVHLLPQKISGLSTISFQYPLKLISPSPSADQRSVLVFLLTYGGGLVGGDQVHLVIDVKPEARLSIVTQGHTKIFKCPSRDVVTRQQLEVTIGTGAAVCLLPDPVQPFESSIYEQSQKFCIAEGGNLCLLDWVSEGRTARGEDWDLGAWSGRNEVWTMGTDQKRPRLLLRDNVILEGDAPGAVEKHLRKKMHALGIFGTLILRGPLMESLANFFLSEFSALPRIGARDFRSQEKVDRDSGAIVSKHESWRASRLTQEMSDGVLWSAARIRGCTVIKFGARTVEGGRNWIGSVIKEEGSIPEEFGDDSTILLTSTEYFIHWRSLSSSTGHWDRLYRQVFDNLKAGAWLEVQESDAWVYTDDASPCPYTQDWCETLDRVRQAPERRPPPPALEAEGRLRRHSEKVVKVPLGPWPHAPALKKLDRFERCHMNESVEAHSMALYTPEDAQIIFARVRSEFNDKSLHLWTAYRFLQCRRSKV